MSISYTKASLYPSRSTNGRSPYKTVALVMHTTEGYGRSYLDGLFSGRYKRDDGVGVSVHWGIYRNGDIVEYAPWKPGEAYWCWHAGTSYMEGYGRSLSRMTLGWELEHKSGNAITEAAIQSMVWLNSMVQAEYRKAGIELKLWTHKDISYPRKIDPTTPWEKVAAPRIYAAWNKTPEDDMTPDEVRKIIREEMEIVWSDTVDRDQSYLVEQQIISAPRAKGKAASVSYVDSLLARVLRKATETPDPQ